MRKILLVSMLLVSLGGCTQLEWVANNLGGTASQATKTDLLNAYSGACNAYKATEHLAAVAINADLLPPAKIDIVVKAQAIATPICTGPLPSNLATVVVQVLAATLEIADTMKGS